MENSIKIPKSQFSNNLYREVIDKRKRFKIAARNKIPIIILSK